MTPSGAPRALAPAGKRDYNIPVRALLGLLLTVSLGSCPVAMSLAAAARERTHACCPAPEAPAQEARCCVSAAAPHAVALADPAFVAIALPPAAPASGSESRRPAPSEEASPPGEPAPAGAASRAPPAVLA